MPEPQVIYEKRCICPEYTQQSGLEARVRLLEEQVELLRRAIALATSTAKPASEWLDESFTKARKGDFRYTSDPSRRPTVSVGDSDNRDKGVTRP
jgi:hypothetical protein